MNSTLMFLMLITAFVSAAFVIVCAGYMNQQAKIHGEFAHSICLLPKDE